MVGTWRELVDSHAYECALLSFQTKSRRTFCLQCWHNCIRLQQLRNTNTAKLSTLIVNVAELVSSQNFLLRHITVST
jgi:hypothetical protein